MEGKVYLCELDGEVETGDGDEVDRGAGTEVVDVVCGATGARMADRRHLRQNLAGCSGIERE